MNLRSSFARMAALLWMSCCLASCGGGSVDTAAQASLLAAQELAARGGRVAVPAGTDLVQVEMRRRALAVTASDRPSAETIALFDFGEANFKQYFPSHQANHVIGSLSYRFYPETGAFLFVDSDSRIYVVGGPFGSDFTFVGVVGDYVKPATDYLLRVASSGTGTGSVGSSTGGISCGSTCSASFGAGSLVTLTATPTAGSTFTGWSGACSGSSATCSVTMDAAKDVTANFATASRLALSVVVDGTGSGVVVASTGGFSCGAACSASYSAGTVITLLAVPTGGSTFMGWSGACSGTAAACNVTMDTAKSVTATFSAAGGI